MKSTVTINQIAGQGVIPKSTSGTLLAAKTPTDSGQLEEANLELTGPGESEKCVILSGGGIGRPHEYDIPVEWKYLSTFDLNTRAPMLLEKEVSKLMCLCGAERERKT